jgi:hypothetical protein
VLTRGLRYGLAAIAVLVSVWFLIGARQAHEVDAATTLLDNGAGHTAGGAQRVASLLSSAGFLYPGTDVPLLRVRLDMDRHEYASAKALIDRSVASEPDNVNAWIWALQLGVVQPSAENAKAAIAHLQDVDPVDVYAIGH